MSKKAIKTVSVHELKTKMVENPNLCLIDVREIHEWQDIRIPGAIHIPKDLISTQINSITKNQDDPIYLHCRSGVRSLYAAECLSALGYQEVYSVNGGIMEWSLSGYPIEE